jgi:hypothetical protein
VREEKNKLLSSRASSRIKAAEEESNRRRSIQNFYQSQREERKNSK